MSIIVSKINKALVVPTDGSILTMWPDAPKLDDEHTIVEHTIRNTILLRQLGYNIPSPMPLYYDWNGGKPFRVQELTCAMLSENWHSYVLNHMGTGKTACALWTYDNLNKLGLVNKMLVVAPLSTLNFTWAREAFKLMPERKVSVLHGTKARRIERLAADADIYIINHDGVRVIAKELAERKDIDVLVLDELAVYRNNTDRSKLMRKMASQYKVVWGMTGAPMPNAPTDVWGQCRIVTPERVPKYFNQARDLLMRKVDQFRWVPKPDAVENAFNMMQPSVRFSLDDVVELPEIVSRVVDVDLTPQQKKTYDALLTQFRVEVESKQITALNAAVAMGKLLQVSGGWVYTTAPEYVKLDAQPRIDALVDLIGSTDHKVLVFAPFRHMLEGLSKIFDAHDISHCVVHGEVSDRDTLFNLFQNTDKYKILLAHPECLAHGLTLTAADTIIWYAPIASLEIYDQANARIRRVGQMHRQQIIHLQATKAERRIYSLLRNKQKVQDELLLMFEDATDRRVT